MNMIRNSLLVSCCSALLLGGCAAHQMDSQRLPVEMFSGHVTRSPTGVWFTPCASSDPSAKWWVTWTGTSVEQAERAKASGLMADGERAFVRWRASRTDERTVGPGGPALLVREILEIRAPRADDCAGGYWFAALEV